MTITASQWLEKIRQLPLPPKIKIMNVCGGHERAITAAGLRTILPSPIELIPGPGCPVCICPEEDIHTAIQLALQEKITLVAFGDMLRVPINVSKKEIRSLEQAKAVGADIHPVASPLEVLQIAQQHPEKTIVFFATGFETTTAPVAALLAQGIPDNLLILLSGRLTWPAVALLLESGQATFDALIAPGHVATVMGSQEWEFVVTQHHLPAAIAGFTPQSLLAAIYSVLRQYLERNYFLDNCYPQVVTAQGNLTAKQYLQQTLIIEDASWRGIGTIPLSGFTLRNHQYDAKQRFPDYVHHSRQHHSAMPPGCDCAKVVLGRIYPNECYLYGTVCTPRTPIGPCMVSEEGACRIWWSGGVRSQNENRTASP
ncbi:MAG: hydrogenase formation protein HypD [Beggiatoa sp. IS2]|nr:MAG: hydrogenase formation protein HypD [Beggiatoa sp. IS2]